MKIRRLSASRDFRRPGWVKAASGRFLSDRNGTTAIEFAMIAVPFMGLIGAVLETGNVYFRTSQLQLTTETAGRNVLTHSTSNVAANMTYQQFIDNYVCTHGSGSNIVKPGTLGMMFDCSKVVVDIQPVNTWGATYSNNFYSSPNLPSSTINMPAAGSVAIVRIVYPVSAVAAILTGGAFKGQTIGVSRAGQTQYSGNNNAWSYMIMGIYAFKVEP
jgi:Flp pilus assembly protein TadG